MKRKISILGIALVMLCAVAAFVFAEAGVSFTSSSVTVRNTVRGVLPKVEICVTFQDSRGVRSEQTWTFTNVRAGSPQTRNLNDSGLRIIGAFSTYCAVPIPE